MPELAQIWIYPIKSLPGVRVDQAQLLSGHALEFDRRWAIFDQAGKYVNGKRQARIHQLQAKFSLIQPSVILQANHHSATFDLTAEQNQLAQWLSKFFGFPVELRSDQTLGFPDDPQASGPTLVSTASLEAVASWYPDLTLEDVRQRFRANLELSGVPAFWEDQLFGLDQEERLFQIGDIQFVGVNPCNRCIVPTRSAQTGAVYPHFQQIFSQRRQETLPAWVVRERFNHFYKLTVNTRLSSTNTGQTLYVGDAVTLLF